MTKDIRLVDPSDLQGCEFEWRYTEDGEKVRVSTRTGRLIPIPESNNHTHDYKTKGAYVEREAKDTSGKNVISTIFVQKAGYTLLKLRSFGNSILVVVALKMCHTLYVA